jgi:ubiquinone biosynthesis monooxygenase Coq6
MEWQSLKILMLVKAAKHIQADLCIIGGGIVGSSFASKIAQSPFNSKRIILIEGGDLFSKPDEEYSNRISSLRPSSVNYLQELGVWESIPRKWDYSQMKVWDGCSDGKIEFKGSPVATMVENRWIQYSLVQSLQELGDVKLINKERVKTISTLDGRPILELESGMTIDCESLVGADGPNSKVKEYAQIETVGLDYGQHGLVATVDVEECENQTAWQRFLPFGPVALLPVSTTKSSIVWTLDSRIVQKVAQLESNAFVELINAAFHNPYHDVLYLLKQIAGDGKPMVDFEAEAEWGRTRQLQPIHPPWIVNVQPHSRQPFPLRIAHAETYVGERSVLIG